MDTAVFTLFPHKVIRAPLNLWLLYYDDVFFLTRAPVIMFLQLIAAWTKSRARHVHALVSILNPFMLLLALGNFRPRRLWTNSFLLDHWSLAFVL